MRLGVLRRVGCAVVVSVLALPVLAQTPILPFTGAFREGFEQGPGGILTACLPNPIFSGQATLCTPSGAHCIVANAHGSNCNVLPHGGARLFVAFQGVCEIVFDTSVLRFGGWTGNFVASSARFDFYADDDRLVGSGTVPFLSGCQMGWFGWDLSGHLPPVKRVVVLTQAWGGLVLDDLEADVGPLLPVTYCRPGTTTQGCEATITANTNPTISHAPRCLLTITGIDGQRGSLVFYGLSRQQVPWCTLGSGSSTLCVKAPAVPIGVQNSGGTPGACDGSVRLDWSAFQLGHPGSLGTPWTPGEKAFVQTWFRDPPACRSTNLSNALELTYLP